MSNRNYNEERVGAGARRNHAIRDKESSNSSLTHPSAPSISWGSFIDQRKMRQLDSTLSLSARQVQITWWRHIWVWAAMTFASSVGAVDYWIGRPPTNGEIFRGQVQEVLTSAVKAKSELGSFQAQLRERRRAYFTARPDQREKEGDSFAEYLFAKDWLYAQLWVVGGYTSQTAAQQQLMLMLNGNKEIDDGIPKLAKPKFNEWIRGMRVSLGARSDTQLVMLSPNAFEAALRANTSLYSAYRLERDKGEYFRWKADQPDPQRSADLPLREAVSPRPPSDYLRTKTSPKVYRDEIAKAQESGSSMLMCEYGPYSNSEGEQVYRQYLFWYRSVPTNIRMLMASGWGDNIHTVLDHVIEDCPKVEAKAREAHSAPQKTVLTDVDHHAVRDAEKAQVADQTKARSDANEAKRLNHADPGVVAARQACYAQYEASRRADPAVALARLKECMPPVTNGR